MFYTRGSADDYDRFARVTGDEGWSWKNVQKYIVMVLLFLQFFRDDAYTVEKSRSSDSTPSKIFFLGSRNGVTRISEFQFSQSYDIDVVIYA